MDINQKYEELCNAIRNHRDQKGDDRCWIDDGLLYSKLPEGYEKLATGGQQLCPDEMLANCKKYIASRHDPTQPYVSDRREIDDLREYIGLMLAIIAGLFIRAGFPSPQEILQDDAKYERMKTLKTKLYGDGG